MVPGSGCDQSSVRRNGKTGDRSRVPIEHLVRLLLTERPDCNMRIRAGSDDASIFQKCGSVHRTVVKAHHLLGRIACERPADRGRIEAA